MLFHTKKIILYFLLILTVLEAFSTTTVSTKTAMKFVNGVSDIVDDYDIFLLDMWGVMHDGTNTYDGVIDTIEQLKKRGKKMIILSNSSKRRNNSDKMLLKLGFNPTDDFEQIITSGEISYKLLSGDDESLIKNECEDTIWQPLLLKTRQSDDEKQNVFVFGSGNEDEEYCNEAGWTCSSIEDAHLVVARGTFTINDGSSVVSKAVDGEEKYFEKLNTALEVASKRRIPMLVCNPDKVRPDEGLPPMPGAIGDAYEKALHSEIGEDKQIVKTLIKRIGKPFPEVYDIALHGRSKDRVCMVGDALETDITGGMKCNIPTIWVVKDGIHGPDVLEKGNGSHEKGCNMLLEEFNKRRKERNTYAKEMQTDLLPSICMPHFKW